MNTTVKTSAKKQPRVGKPDFEDTYIAVRSREKRIYTDAQLQLLPDVEPSHIYAAEWGIRKRSSKRLIDYLKHQKKRLKILEVGCGNGWLSAKMAEIPNAKVVGLDINMTEIEQAKRVFVRDNLEFIYDTFNDSTFNNDKFDVIVFAASLQYFSSIINIIKQAQAILRNTGEIHIIDTHFYESENAIKAEERSRDYYASMGFPEMANYYYHHSLSEFWGFNYSIPYDPDSFLHRVLKKDPFYWIIISK